MTSDAADAATATEEIRVKFTVATVQPPDTVAHLGGLAVVVFRTRIEGER
jgi:hypothetical protein